MKDIQKGPAPMRSRMWQRLYGAKAKLTAENERRGDRGTIALVIAYKQNKSRRHKSKEGVKKEGGLRNDQRQMT